MAAAKLQGTGEGAQGWALAGAQGWVRARRRLGRARSSSARAGLAGPGGALRTGPRGLAGVSKVTLRCASAAVAAGARSSPGLWLRSGSGSSRPGAAPALTTQHPDTHQDPLPRGPGRSPPAFPRRSVQQLPLPSSEPRRREGRAGPGASLPLHLAFPGPGGRETELEQGTPKGRRSRGKRAA